MDGFRVFLRGHVTIDQALSALESLRPVEVLDGPIGPVDAVCLRDNVFVELVAHHHESDLEGVALGTYQTMLRFLDTDSHLDQAWVSAHAFLWIVTRRAEVEEALLIGPATEPLRFRDGRIMPLGTRWDHRERQERYSEEA